MDVYVIDEEIYKCLDELDTLLVQDLSHAGQWQGPEEENEEKTNSVQVLHCIHKFFDTNDSLKNNSNILYILKCIFHKHKLLFNNSDYEQEQSNDELPSESYGLRKCWRFIYPHISRVLVNNLIRNELDNLNKQFRFSDILEFFLLIERTNFWQFYERIRRERLLTIGRECVDFKQFIEKLVKTLEYEVHLVCNYRYVQNLMIEYCDFILIYSNLIKSKVSEELDAIRNESNTCKLNTQLTILTELKRFDEAIKVQSKQWIKLELPNSVNQKRMQFDWRENFMKRDHFNFLLNELNKELNAITGDQDEPMLQSIVSTKNNTKVLAPFVSIVKVLDRYNLVHVKQLKKSFMVIVEVNINQFIQIKFSKLLRRIRFKQLNLYLNTLYYLKENFSNYGVDLSKVNELISDLECDFKANHLFVLNLNIEHMEYFMCYLKRIEIDLRNTMNYDLFRAQKLYQDLLQQALIQLDGRHLQNNDLLLLLSNLDLLMFTYDNENLFALHPSSPFQKIVNKIYTKFLFRITLFNAPIKLIADELSRIDDHRPDKRNWLEHFDPSLYTNLPYYHAMLCNRKSVKHFTFICRPFLEYNCRFTVDLIAQLIANETFLTCDKNYRKNRNRLLSAIFNLITSSQTQPNSLYSIIGPLMQNQTFNSDNIQFELLLDDSLIGKHATRLNQLDWMFSLIKLVKRHISEQFEIVLNNFLYKYIDLINVIELDPSIQHLFAKLSLKFSISEQYLIDELTESIFKLISNSLVTLPNGLFYSLESLGKDLKLNDAFIFNSLTAHIILFAICKRLKSRLKVLVKQDVYTKIVGNLLSWFTFANDQNYNLIKYQNRFNDLVLRRKMNLNVDFVEVDENQELESLFRLIELNYDNYSKDIDLLEHFLAANNDYLNKRLNNEEFKKPLNLSPSFIDNSMSQMNVTKIYKAFHLNYSNAIRHLKTSFDYESVICLMRTEANKTFIKTYLIERFDMSSDTDSQHVEELKKLFQIT